MKKKLKNVCVSLLISCLLVPCFCLSMVVSAIDPSIIIETAVAAIELTVATADALTDSYEQQHQENVSAMFKAMDEQIGNSSVTVLNYAFVTGKCQWRYLSRDNVERSVNMEVSMYYLENYSGAQYNDGYDCPIVWGKDGNSYLANNLYFDIWYSDGTHYRIRYKPDSYLGLQQQFNYNAFPSSGDLFLRIMRPTQGRFFNVTDNTPFGTELTSWGNSSNYVQLYYEPKNTIVLNPNNNYYTNQSYQYQFNNTTVDNDLAPTRNMALGYYPLPRQICFNACEFTQYSSSGSTSYTNRYVYYIGAFFDTNSSSLNNSYNYMNSSKKNCGVFYYDNTCIGGTTIDNSNKTTVINGVLAPDFDVNGLFTGIANLQASIKPLLDLSLPDITNKVTNYFENMPDFNNLWTDTKDNDYYVLPWDDLPPDNPSTGDITVLVTVDVSRPLVPEFTTSSRWLYIDVGNLTTTVEAVPSEYVSAAQTIQNKTDDVFDELEMIPIYLGLAIFGVAVSILMKGA